MKGRSAKTLHWGIVVSWVVIGAWFLAVVISNRSLSYGDFTVAELLRIRSLNALLADPLLTIIVVIATFGTATSLYVFLRLAAGRVPSIAVSILVTSGLTVFGVVVLPQVNFEIILFSTLLSPFPLVFLSWLVHRRFRSGADSLPALGPFTLAVLKIAFYPLLLYFFFGLRDALRYRELMAAILFDSLIIFGIVGLVVFNWLWERGSGRSFLAWWRDPGSTPGKTGPPASQGSRLDFLLIGTVVVSWIPVSLWLLPAFFGIASGGVNIDSASILAPTYLVSTTELIAISGSVLLGTIAAIAVLSRAHGSKRSLLSVIVGLPALLLFGFVGLPLVPSGIIYLTPIPFAIAVAISGVVFQRHLKYIVSQWTPPLGAYLLALLLVAYVPLFIYIVAVPVDPLLKGNILGQAQLGHVVALGITAIALVRSGRFALIGDGNQDGTITLAEWPLVTYTPNQNPVAPRADPPAGFRNDGWTNGSGVRAAPVVKDDTVVTAEADGTVTAYDAVSGARSWTVGRKTERSPDVAIEFGSVYVSADRRLTAFSLETGEQLWEETFERAVIGPPTPFDDSLYVAFEDGTVHSRSAKTGVDQWQTELDGGLTEPPAVANGLVYVATVEGSIVAMDCETGDRRWSVETDGSALNTPVVHAGTVYATDESGTVWFAEAALGNELESTVSGVADARRPVVTDESILVTGPDELVALSHPGEIRWDIDFAGLRGIPMVVGDTVIAYTDSEVFCMSLEMGQHRFSIKTDGAIEGIAPTSEAFYVATDAGLLGLPEASSAGDWGRSEEGSSESPVEDTAQRAESSPDETDGAPTTQPEAPTSVAEGFARDCDAVTAASVVDDQGPVHTYDVRFVDDAGAEDARCYVLAPSVADNPDAIAEFESVVRRWQSIGKNTHIATVFGSGETPRPWVAFDPGDRRLDEGVANLDRDECLDVIVDVTEGIRTANMYNINHGCLSPRNVFLGTDENGDSVATVADWGLGRRIGAVVDEPSVDPYTAPEQLDGDSAGTQTDVYRLGSLCHRLFTGKEPFVGDGDVKAAIRSGDIRPSQRGDDSLPESAVEVSSKAMDPDPDERFGTPYDFQQRLLVAFD